MRVTDSKLGAVMQLSEFVSESLKQIFSGLTEARKHAQEQGFQVNPWLVSGKSDLEGILIEQQTRTPIQLVEFDVAVTAVESKDSKAGAGIFVASLGLGG